MKGERVVDRRLSVAICGKRGDPISLLAALPVFSVILLALRQYFNLLNCSSNQHRISPSDINI